MAALNRIFKAWKPVLASALVLAGLATASTPAAAASTNRIGLCNKATYSALLLFPNTLRGSYLSELVAPGKCWSATINAGSREPVDVFAFNSSREPRYVISASVNTNVKNVFRTYGTYDAPYITLLRD
ncbi:hypothetical protein [Micromonospora sp. NPDC003241]